MIHINWRVGFGSFARYLALVTMVLAWTVVSAQSPSSPDYHRVFLPAHQAGDTLRHVDRKLWGASAVSEPDASGISLSGFSVGYEYEHEARAAAIAMCSERGGVNCQVELVFANNCAVVAASDEKSSVRQARPLRRARNAALKACGPACRVLHEGCALP